MISLADALAQGQGIERPFQCPVHDDHHASASVNVIKNVWYCYACHASGTVEGGKAPSPADLESMLEPDTACRVYPDTWLQLFANDIGNFAGRFPDWVRRTWRLGGDPLTGDAVFPVHTPAGLLAGVGRRKVVVGEGPRYIYPVRWSASRTLFRALVANDGIYVLTEGAADATSVAEAGANALGCYGSGVHAPQRELIARVAPKLLLLGFDADDAGRWAAERTATTLSDICELALVDWSIAGGKDPAELPVQARRDVLAKSVGSASYGSGVEASTRWAQQASLVERRYLLSVEKEAA